MTAEQAKKSRRTQARNPGRGSKPGERRGGRAKGTPNKATKDIREAIRELLEQSAPKMGKWLERVATTDPGKAIDLALKAAEYAIPKLSRATVNVDGQGGLEALVSAMFVGREPERAAIDASAEATRPVPASESAEVTRNPTKTPRKVEELPAQPERPRPEMRPLRAAYSDSHKGRNTDDSNTPYNPL